MINYFIQHNEDTIEAFREFQRMTADENILKINGNIPIFNLPGTLDKSLVDNLEYDAKNVLECIQKLVHHLMINNKEQIMTEMGFSKEEVQIFMRTLNNNEFMMSRCDVIIDKINNSYSFLEFNIDSSVGGIEIAEVNKVMLKLPVYYSYFKEDQWYYTDPLDTFCKLLKQSFTKKIKTIAIIDWSTCIDGYVWSLQTMKEKLENYGYEVVVGSEKDLTYDDKCLFVDNKKIDLVYRVFLNEDAKNHYESIEPILKAYENGNLYLISGLHTEVYSSKLLFPYLLDPKYQQLFTEEQKLSIKRTIPYSCILSEATIEEVITNRESIVLKPANGYGGKGILLGWNFSDTEWQIQVEDIVKSPQMFIAQTRVNGSIDKNLFIEDNHLVSKEMNSIWGCYIFNGHFAGIMYRGMEKGNGEIVNAAQGAGMTASFIYK